MKLAAAEGKGEGDLLQKADVTEGRLRMEFIEEILIRIEDTKLGGVTQKGT